MSGTRLMCTTIAVPSLTMADSVGGTARARDGQRQGLAHDQSTFSL
jgi:hypothetical protein